MPAQSAMQQEYFFVKWFGRKKQKQWIYNGENLEKLLLLQEEGGEDFFKLFFFMDASFTEWAFGVQKRFAEVLEEKDAYLADRSALPYPESWIRLAFKVQAFRALQMKEESFLSHIIHGFDHLAAFLVLNPKDRENLFIVERYREELKAMTPGQEESSFFSDGKSAKEVLRGYTRALPTFNAYHAKVEEGRLAYRKEFQEFCEGIRKILTQ